MRDVKTVEGRDAKLRVQVAGKPRPEVEWLRDNKPVSRYDRRVKMEEDYPGGYSLIIRDTVGVATNSAGKTACTARDVIESKCTMDDDDDVDGIYHNKCIFHFVAV